MHRPARLVAPGLMLLLAACVVTPPAAPPVGEEGVVKKAGATTVTGELPPDLSTPTPAPAGSLTGTVYAPAGIVAAGGLNLVELGGLGIVAAGGLNYALASAGGRRLLALTQAPVKAAQIQLFDAANKPVGPAVTTDDNGRYTLPNFPATGGPMILKVGVKDGTGAALALETVVRPGESLSADVDAATTVVTSAVLARTKGKLETVHARDFRRAASAVAALIGDEGLPDLAKPATLVTLVADLSKTSAELRDAVAALAGEAQANPGPDGTASPTTGASGSPGPSASPGATPSPGATTSPTASGSPTPIPAATAPVLTGLAALTGTAIFTGSLTSGFKDGEAAGALFKSPVGLAIDSQGIVYTCDLGNQVVRRIDLDGKVTTLAGKNGVTGTAADTATGIDARFSSPGDLVATDDSTLFILDRGNRVIRKLTHVGGVADTVMVTKFSGSGTSGFKEGAAAECQYTNPVSIAYDGVNTLFVTDYEETGATARILAVDTATGDMRLFAGGASKGTLDGPALDARFRKPAGIAVRQVAGKREVWIADQGAGNLRRLAETDAGLVADTPVGPVAPTAEGTDPAIYGERNTFPLSRARFKRPGRLTFTPSGDLLVIDTDTGVLRWIRFTEDGTAFDVRSLGPASVATGGTTEAFRVEGTEGTMSDLVYSPVKKKVYVSMGSFASIKEIR
jgi:hypothetical protein